MKTVLNIKMKCMLLIVVLCFWCSEASAYDWSTRPIVKIDSSGNATAVWEGTDPTTLNAIIQMNYLPNGGSWTGVVNLSSADDNSFSPIVAVNSGGDAVVIWQSYDNMGNTFLRGISKAAAGSFSSVQNISSSGEIILAHYDVSISSGGYIIASWDAYIDSSFVSVIRSATSTIMSGTWSLATTISP
jgi:hypothetical protein